MQDLVAKCNLHLSKHRETKRRKQELVDMHNLAQALQATLTELISELRTAVRLYCLSQVQSLIAKIQFNVSAPTMTQRVSNLVHRIREFLQDERADGLPVRAQHHELRSHDLHTAPNRRRVNCPRFCLNWRSFIHSTIKLAASL